MAFALIPSFISLALLFWWRSVVLFKRTVEDVPTSKVKGVFYGLNEVKGMAKSEFCDQYGPEPSCSMVFL